MGENYRVNGYAYTITNLNSHTDVSVDGGKTWYMAGVNTYKKNLKN